MKIKIIVSVIFLVLVAASAYFFSSSSSKTTHSFSPSDSISVKQASFIPEKKMLYGMEVDSLQVEEERVKANQSLSDILLSYKVSPKSIFQLANKAKGVFDVRKIAPNKKYTVIYNQNDTVTPARALIYEPNAQEYVVFNLQDSISVYRENKEVEFKERSISGIIKNRQSLYENILEAGGTPVLVDMMADMYGWQIDFEKIYPGDKFRVLYTEKVVEGASIGVGEILAAEFIHYDNSFLSIAFDQGDGVDYFDEDGKSLQKAFLRYPVKYTRISSRYTKRRFHPVQKRYKAHLGTDYAAPTGTPIFAAGDGIVTEARYSKYNGNYVKIRHNATFDTQYLHMSKIEKGIRPGMKVKQGQKIGKVGSTGLATGPHLCYRFWKNGRQVDALKVELPPSNPIKEEKLTTYNRYKDFIFQRLDKVSYPDEENKVLMASVK